MTTDSTEHTTMPRAGRITVEESCLDLVDQIVEMWRRVYATALRDPAARAAVQRAARLVDPDFASAGALWQSLVERMPPVVTQQAPAAHPAHPRAT